VLTEHTVPGRGGSAYGSRRLLDRRALPTTVVVMQDGTTPGHPGDDGEQQHEPPQPDRTGEDSPDGEELPFAGALGIDPDFPDPGCEHDWRNLHFLEDDEGLVCSRCGRAWAVDEDTRDTVLTLWHSTRRAVEDLALGQERLNRIIEELTGVRRCHWCQSWSDDTEDFVEVNFRRCCPEHLGQLLAQVAPADEDDLAAVRDWLGRLLTEKAADVYTVWLAEKSVVECPELLEGATDSTGLTVEAIGQRTVELPAEWAARIGTVPRTSVNALSAKVARLLDLPSPTSRAGRAFLVGTLARALRAAEKGEPLDAESLTEALLEAAPSGNRDRATIVLDLYREEMQVDGTVTGEMADDLVEALIGRAAAEFAPLVIHDTPETGPSDGDPR
jgi:hypothetical protein